LWSASSIQALADTFSSGAVWRLCRKAFGINGLLFFALAMIERSLFYFTLPALYDVMITSLLYVMLKGKVNLVFAKHSPNGALVRF
jgi:hypothetical protein